MANRIGIRPRARLDVVELAGMIGTQSVLAADRFLDACQATCELLSGSPAIGSLYHSADAKLSGLRVFPVRGFRHHLIFYWEREYGIEIVRVLHGASDLDAALLAD
jgi:toxin ParE1/3/4